MQRLADRVDGAEGGLSAHIRAEIPRAILRRPRNDRKARIVLRRVQPDIRIALVVLQQNVVLGLIFFYHRIFEHERLELALGNDDVEGVDMADELARFGVQALGRLKIVRHTVAQQLGLADVDDPAGLVLVHIYARLHGEPAHALFQLFSCHGRPFLPRGFRPVSIKKHRPKTKDRCSFRMR